MRSKILIVALAAVVGGGAAGFNAYTQQPAPSLEISRVAEGLYVIVGSGGNVAVRVTDDGVFVVDDKFEQDYDQIIDRIGSVTDQPVRYVLNTHHHGDHSGGNARFAEFAQIIAHTNARENILRNDQTGAPAIVYSDQAGVFLGDIEVEAHHVGRGHTNGDAVILFPDLGVIHTGDLFVGSTPFIDYRNGGSAVEWLTTLDNILQLEFETVIPGHGNIMTREDIETFRGKMLTMQLRARGLISRGVSRDELGSRLDVSDLGWNYSQGLAASSIPGLYDELTQ